MSLRRVGATAFAAGLLVFAALLVTVGPARTATDLLCPGPQPLTEYVIVGVQAWPSTLRYTDGCNDFLLRPSVLWSGVLAVGGLLLAGIGEIRAE